MVVGAVPSAVRAAALLPGRCLDFAFRWRRGKVHKDYKKAKEKAEEHGFPIQLLGGGGGGGDLWGLCFFFAVRFCRALKDFRLD